MTPGQQLQKMLGEVPGYEAADIVTLLPFAAALQSALYARMMALQNQAGMPDTDYLLNTDEIAARLGELPRWRWDQKYRGRTPAETGNRHAV